LAIATQTYYAVSILIGIMLCNYLTGNLVSSIIRVRMSKGKKILINVRGTDQWYWTVAELNNDYIRYKDRDKLKKSIILEETLVMRSFNLPFVITDSVRNCLMKTNLQGVSGFDAKSVDNIIVRALTAPTTDDDRMKKYILIGVAACILGIGYIAVRALPGLELKIDQVLNLIQNMRGVV
jgi:hypothetical protein